MWRLQGDGASDVGGDALGEAAGCDGVLVGLLGWGEGGWGLRLVGVDGRVHEAACTANLMRRMLIRGGRVTLGDGGKAKIITEGGHRHLCGGELMLNGDTLVRRGRSAGHFALGMSIVRAKPCGHTTLAQLSVFGSLFEISLAWRGGFHVPFRTCQERGEWGVRFAIDGRTAWRVVAFAHRGLFGVCLACLRARPWHLSAGALA